MVRVSIPPQSQSKAVVCVSTPRMYPRSGYFLVPYKVRVRIKTIISLGFALNCMSCKAGLTGPCLDDETPTSLTCPANNVCGRLDCEGSGVEMLILACIPKAGQPLECSTVVRKIGKWPSVTLWKLTLVQFLSSISGVFDSLWILERFHILLLVVISCPKYFFMD